MTIEPSKIEQAFDEKLRDPRSALSRVMTREIDKMKKDGASEQEINEYRNNFRASLRDSVQQSQDNSPGMGFFGRILSGDIIGAVTELPWVGNKIGAFMHSMKTGKTMEESERILAQSGARDSMVASLTDGELGNVGRREARAIANELVASSVASRNAPAPEGNRGPQGGTGFDPVRAGTGDFPPPRHNVAALAARGTELGA